MKGFGLTSFIMATPPLLMEAEDLLVPLMLAWLLLTAAAQYFVDAPPAAMTASGLLQCDPQSLAVSPTASQAPSGQSFPDLCRDAPSDSRTSTELS